MTSLPPRLFVTGTDTDVGKTVVSALLCAAFNYEYYKPVQAGVEPCTDSETVARLARCVVHPERFRLLRPASPHASATDEGLTLRLDDFSMPDARRLLVEGAGGIAVPLCDNPMLWQVDLIRRLDLPVVLVSRTALGTLNHTFLTVHYLRDHGVEIVGIILVGPPHPENERDVGRWGAPVLARVPIVDALDSEFPRLTQELRTQIGATP